MDYSSQTPSSESKEIPDPITHNPSDEASRRSDHMETPPTPCESSRPRFRTVEEAREKLKFILGASEDNSSEDEASVKSQIRRERDGPEGTLQETHPHPAASQSTGMR